MKKPVNKFFLEIHDFFIVIIALMIFKPFVMYLLYKIFRIKNLSHFSEITFILRLNYDFVVCTLIAVGMNNEKIKIISSLTMCLPLLAFEVLIFCYSVKPGSKKARKLHFRMVRTRINTDE